VISIGLSIVSTVISGGKAAITELPALTGAFDILDGFIGQQYYINLNSLNTGGRATSWDWVGTPPAWATLSNTGIISGTATEGSWTGYAVKAINDLGSSTSNTDSVAITLQTPILSGLFDLVDGVVGDSYNYDLNTINTGGIPASWAWTGTPPPWANLDTVTGIITGTATEGSWSGYAVTATNATGSDTTNTDSITITAELVAPALTGLFDIPNSSIDQSINIDLTLINTGGLADSWAWSGAAYPSWANLNTSTGLITGNTQEGSWSGYSVTATNTIGSSVSNTDDVTIDATPFPPWVGTTFIGAYRGQDNIQNIGIDGEICNLMPLGTVTATSLHTAPILAPDKDGLYHEYAVDEPVWKGIRVDGGVAYATDDAGDPLPAPFVQANDAATNLNLHSSDITSWSPFNSIQVTYDQVGILGNPDTATKLFDSGVHYAEVRSTVASPSGPIVVKVYVKKDSDETRFPGFVVGGGAAYIFLNTKTGYTWNNGNTYDIKVISEGLWWILLVSFDNASDSTLLNIWPALAETQDGGISGNAEGSIIIGNYELYRDTSVSTLERLQPIFTTNSAVSIPATHYTYPAANIDPSNQKFSLRLDYAGEAEGNVLDIGGNLTLKYGYVGTGPELVVNGNFDVEGDVTGWGEIYGGGRGVLESVGGQGKAYRPDDSTGNEYYRQTVPVVHGDMYIFAAEIEGVTPNEFVSNTSRCNLFYFDGTGSLSTYGPEAKTEQYVGAANNASNTIIIDLYTPGSEFLSAGSYSLYDNISLKAAVPALILSDGTNYVSIPITAGIRDVEITLTGSQMTLNLDGTEVTGAYTPVAAGLITVEESHWALHAKSAPPTHPALALINAAGELLTNGTGNILT